MPKYHVSSSGLPSRCNASIRECPVGGAHAEFENATAAREWTEQVLAKQYGVKPEKKAKKATPKAAAKTTELTPEERARGAAKVEELLAQARSKMAKHQSTMSAPRFDESDSHVAWAARERSNFLGAHSSRLRVLQAEAAMTTDRDALVSKALSLATPAPEASRSSDAFQAWQASQQATADFLNAYDPEGNETKTFNDKLDNKISWHYDLYGD